MKSAGALGLLALMGPACATARRPEEESEMADTIITHARVTTLDRAHPEAQAIAVRNGLVQAVGSRDEIMRLADRRTRVIDAGGRRVIPGLNDSHTHLIRGGLNYNMELRWEGVPSAPRSIRARQLSYFRRVQ
jgi:predicted amidohydrolase YtcJ